MKDSGHLEYFLGIKVTHSKHGICLNQRKYILELISDAGLSGVRFGDIPMEQNLRLTSKEYDDSARQQSSVDSLLDDSNSYFRLI